MAASDSSGLLVALDPSRSGEDGVVGCLTLVLFRIPTGLRAWSEAANRLYRRLGFRKRDTTVSRHQGDGG
jgi:hypothetical protein